MKSMVHGIPMVLVPWGRDQPGVAARAGRLGTAVVVQKRGCSVAALIDAIETIVNNTKYQQKAQMISSRLRKMDGVANAVGHIEQFLKNSEGLP